jgi:hypothetical protein
LRLVVLEMRHRFVVPIGDASISHTEKADVYLARPRSRGYHGLARRLHSANYRLQRGKGVSDGASVQCSMWLALYALIDEDNQPVLPKDVEFEVGAEKLRALKSTLKRQHTLSFLQHLKACAPEYCMTFRNYLSRSAQR